MMLIQNDAETNTHPTISLATGDAHVISIREQHAEHAELWKGKACSKKSDFPQLWPFMTLWLFDSVWSIVIDGFHLYQLGIIISQQIPGIRVHSTVQSQACKSNGWYPCSCISCGYWYLLGLAYVPSSSWHWIHRYGSSNLCHTTTKTCRGMKLSITTL